MKLAMTTKGLTKEAPWAACIFLMEGLDAPSSGSGGVVVLWEGRLLEMHHLYQSLSGRPAGISQARTPAPSLSCTWWALSTAYVHTRLVIHKKYNWLSASSLTFQELRFFPLINSHTTHSFTLFVHLYPFIQHLLWDRDWLRTEATVLMGCPILQGFVLVAVGFLMIFTQMSQSFFWV